MVAEYVPDFIKSFAADKFTDPSKSGTIIDALKFGGRKRPYKKSPKTLRRTAKLSRSPQKKGPRLKNAQTKSYRKKKYNP
jgi:hypothetical protein